MRTLAELMSEGVNDPDIFKVVFLAGGPGSGKSYIQKNATSGSGLVLSNSDIIYTIGLGKAGLSLKMPDSEEEARKPVRDKAKELTGKRLRLWIEGRLGIVVDGTGHDYARIKKQKEEFEALGYDCYMIFVNTSLDVALERNEKRDRSVPPDVVKDRWNAVQNNIGKFQTLFGGQNFIVYDNNTYAKKEDFHPVWKKVRMLLNKPIKNHIALDWIKNQRKK